MCRLSFLVFEKEAEYIMPFIVVSFIYLFHPFEARKSLDKPRNVKLETLMIEWGKPAKICSDVSKWLHSQYSVGEPKWIAENEAVANYRIIELE